MELPSTSTKTNPASISLCLSPRVLSVRFHNKSQIHPFDGSKISHSSNCLEGFKNPFTSRAHRSLKQQKELFPAAKQSTATFKRKTVSSNKSSKFLRVRQRPSRKWVAEIKNTSQKIRMWLGTFDTAEEAARAYDEAAFLLRGSNTRMNFVDPIPPNSPLSLKIRNLFNHKIASKQNLTFPPTDIPIETTNSGKSFWLTQSLRPVSVSQRQQEVSTQTLRPASASQGQHKVSTYNGGTSHINNNRPHFSFGDGYKPDLSQCNMGGFEMGFSQLDHPFPFATQFEAPNQIDLTPQISTSQVPGFEDMKNERQISASLYTRNGTNGDWENVDDCGDSFWDLPMYAFSNAFLNNSECST